MKEMDYFILAALVNESPLHGYALLKLVGDQRGREVRASSLYDALARLARDQDVAVEREEIVDGRARRYYTITESGKAAVREEARRLRRVAGLVKPAARQVTA